MASSTSHDSPPQALELYQDVYRFAYSLCFNAADAADFTQQTYMKLASHGHTILDKAKVKSWLFTTVHREFLQQRRRVVRFPHTSLEEENVAEMPAPQHNESSLDSAEVLHALGQMEENLRTPLALFYLKDMRYREIAEVLGIPIGTVMSRLSRAKLVLRQALGLEEPTAPTLATL
jgi:RNA polymerase sigma-70 factor, ECF subfamily